MVGPSGIFWKKIWVTGNLCAHEPGNSESARGCNRILLSRGLTGTGYFRCRPNRGQPSQIFVLGFVLQSGCTRAVMQPRQGCRIILFCRRNRHLGQIVAKYIFGIDLIHRGLALGVTGHFPL